MVEPPSIVPIYCRYVHTDRWLLIHLDTSWKILQVKQCLLNTFVPNAATCTSKACRPRKDRPMSPITFSSHGHGHTDDEGDSDYQSAEEEPSDPDALDDVVQDADFYRYKYTPATRTATGNSSTTLVTQPEALAQPSPANFTLLAFSTGQILEDHFQFGWYPLGPYELLEFYPRGDPLVSLPRGNPEAYIRPYFEARVWALRFVGDDLSAEYNAELERPRSRGKVMRKGKGKEREARVASGSGGGSVDGDGEDARVGDADQARGKDKSERKRKKKMEWRERWVVIHQGMFKLCRDRNDHRPTHSAPLTALLALRGEEHLHPRTTALPPPVRDPSSSKSTPLSSPSPAQSLLRPSLDRMKPPLEPSSAATKSRRIVCAKFRAGPYPPPHSPARVSSGIWAAGDEHGGDGGGWWRRGSRDASAGEALGMAVALAGVKRGARADLGEGSSNWDRLGADDEASAAVWIVMDLLDDVALDDFLRVIHRHAPLSCSSSFVSHFAPPPVAPLPETGYTFPMSRSSPHDASLGLPSHTSSTTLACSLRHDSAASEDKRSRSPGSAPKGLPYPEWRLSVIHRARRAGVGAVGRAMELVIFGDDDRGGLTSEEDELSVSDILENAEREMRPSAPAPQRPPVASPKQAASPPRAGKRPSIGSDVDVSTALWRDYLNDDSDSGSEGEAEQSEHEWEGWMDDLSRQRRVQADNEERHMRHLSADLDADIPWEAGESLYDETGGVPPRDEGAGTAEAEREPSFSIDAPTTPHGRVISSYSSADSLIRRTARSSRSRPRIPRPFAASFDFPGVRVRARSPLVADERSAPGAGSSPPRRSPVRMPIPVRMRMTSLCGEELELASTSTSPPSGRESTSPRQAGFLRKLTHPREAMSDSQVQSLLSEATAVSSPDQSDPPAVSPPSLMLTIPEPSVSGSSPDSLDSIKFVTPDSE